MVEARGQRPHDRPDNAGIVARIAVLKRTESHLHRDAVNIACNITCNISRIGLQHYGVACKDEFRHIDRRHLVGNADGLRPLVVDRVDAHRFGDALPHGPSSQQPPRRKRHGKGGNEYYTAFHPLNS